MNAIIATELDMDPEIKMELSEMFEDEDEAKFKAEQNIEYCRDARDEMF